MLGLLSTIAWASVTSCATRAGHRDLSDAEDGGFLVLGDAANPALDGSADATLDADIIPEPIEYPPPKDCVLDDRSDSDASGDCLPARDAGPADGCEPFEERDGAGCVLRCADFPCENDCDCPESRGGSKCLIVAGTRNCVFFAEEKEQCGSDNWEWFSVNIRPGAMGPVLCPDDPRMRCSWEFVLLPSGRLEWRYLNWRRHAVVTVAYSTLAECDFQRMRALVGASNAQCANGGVFDYCTDDAPICETAIATPDAVHRFPNACTANVEIPEPLYRAREALWELANSYFHPTYPEP